MLSNYISVNSERLQATHTNEHSTASNDIESDFSFGDAIKKKFESEGHLSLELDCEFYSSLINPSQNETLTTQLRENTDTEDEGVVLSHGRDILDCPKRQFDNPILDYLATVRAYKVPQIETRYEINYPSFEKYLNDNSHQEQGIIVELWGFFLIADLCKAFTGNERLFLNYVINGYYKNHGVSLDHTKYLKSNYSRIIGKGSKQFNKIENWIPTPFYFNGKQIKLKICDISACFGAKVSYEQAGKITKTSLPDKGLMDYYKQDMREAVKDCSDKFIAYALGDLYTRKIYQNWQSNNINAITDLIQSKGIEASFTLGSTVSKIMIGFF